MTSSTLCSALSLFGRFTVLAAPYGLTFELPLIIRDGVGGESSAGARAEPRAPALLAGGAGLCPSLRVPLKSQVGVVVPAVLGDSFSPVPLSKYSCWSRRRFACQEKRGDAMV